MKPGRVCIKFRWVFEIKRDGTFRARLVACGYSQKPGVDFQELYSPVINDTVLQIVVIYQMVKRLIAVLLDVEVAFLHGDLNEIIYMECPDGVAYTGDKVVVLNKSMYGFVQAARQFFLKFKAVLEKAGSNKAMLNHAYSSRQLKIIMSFWWYTWMIAT
jgi:Reverse transcriptase (RNA-dependent DNA polymerase)